MLWEPRMRGDLICLQLSGNVGPQARRQFLVFLKALGDAGPFSGGRILREK